MVSGFSGEHSSPLPSYTIGFVGATCGRPLKQCCYPIDKTINYTRAHTIDNNRPCNGKHLRADAQNKSLCLCQLRTQCFLSKLVKLFRYAAN